MKKTFISLILLSAAMVASAADFTVSGVHDSNIDKNGVRAVLSIPNAVYTPQLSVTYVNDVYTRYGAGAKYNFLKVGPVSFDATGSLVYQDTTRASNGFGATVGLGASMPISKNVSATATVDRFVGFGGLSGQNGMVYGVGVVAKF